MRTNHNFGKVSTASCKIRGMGHSADKSPRKTPNRVYHILPETEASRVVGITLKPMHLWMLELSQREGEGFSRKIQLLIKELAGEVGVTEQMWKDLREEEKEKYLNGRKASSEKQNEIAKQKRRERA